MLEEWAAENEDSRATIEQCFRRLIFDPNLTRYPHEVVAAIEVLENCIIYSREHVSAFCFKSGALDLVASAMASPAEHISLAAQSCLARVIKTLNSEDEETESISKSFARRADIISMFMKCLDDPRPAVASGAADFFQGLPDDEVKKLMTSDTALIRKFVLLLGKKGSNTVGASCEWILLKLGEEGADALVEAFRSVWQDNDGCTFDDKAAVVRGLACSFLDLRKAALSGGMAQFFVNELQNNKKNIFGALVCTIIVRLFPHPNMHTDGPRQDNGR
jgi:hypothetical protein